MASMMKLGTSGPRAVDPGADASGARGGAGRSGASAERVESSAAALPDAWRGAPVAVIGAGTMGIGIAQVAALAGHPVLLHDARAGAAAAACGQLESTFATLVGKGKLTDATARAALARLRPVATLAELAPARIAIEAIVEDLAAKRALFAELETRLAPDAVLASNTSSLSITALARELRAPERAVGMHFFNPVPLMALVEVVAGLRTAPAVAEAVAALAQAWGKTPVHCASTPGFVVNRIARPYYAEALLLLEGRYATPPQIDAALRGAGFRMGPCELMDLIGHDVNYAVTESVFAANHGDRRYAPSRVQRELVDAGLLGRKSGRGFYTYPPAPLPAPVAAPPPPGGSVQLCGHGPLLEQFGAALAARGIELHHVAVPGGLGLVSPYGELWRSDGRSAQQVAAERGIHNVAVFDWPASGAALSAGAPLAFAVAASAEADFAGQAAAWLACAGAQPLQVGDAPGLVVARTLGMLVNEAADAVQQGVCSAAAADTAMQLGTNWPAGPFAWLQRFGAAAVVELLDTLRAVSGLERYRASPLLREQAWRDALATTQR